MNTTTKTGACQFDNDGFEATQVGKNRLESIALSPLVPVVVDYLPAWTDKIGAGPLPFSVE